MKPRIMIFCDSYLPSCTSGGGMWTVVNLVERFSDRYEFYVVTRNHDVKGDKKPYRDVESDSWNRVGVASVFYFSRRNLTKRKVVHLIGEIRPQAIFLNSSLSMPTIKVLSARRKGSLGTLPVILAPCGEMSKAALSLKPYKKKLFLSYAILIDLYRGVFWKASSATEREEIRSVVGKSSDISVAPDLLPKVILPDYSPEWKTRKNSGSVRFVFLSRIMRKKNLHFFLERLRDLSDGTVLLDIIGPVEDRRYWNECRTLIDMLGDNIHVQVLGPFPNQDALRRMSESHFFVLPTLDENFGYVFVEALAAGCPLIISDRNIWTGVVENNAGWRISLDRPEAWLCSIRQCIKMNDAEYGEMSRRARAYALELLMQADAEKSNERIFQRGLGDVGRTINDERIF